MTLSGGSGTMESVAAEYFNWEPDGSPVSIHMHLDAVDGIARDVIEGLKTLPRRGLEVGGLLLGHVVRDGDLAGIWIERYQRILCEHRYGPQFVLDEQDRAAMERAAADVTERDELSIVGLYRSNTRPQFQLEEADYDLIRQYFTDPSDLVLLINPESIFAISAQFFVRTSDGGAQPVGGTFPFRGRAVSIISDPIGEENELADADLTGSAVIEEPPAPARAPSVERPRDEADSRRNEAEESSEEEITRPTPPSMARSPRAAASFEATPVAPEPFRRTPTDFAAPSPAEQAWVREPRGQTALPPHLLVEPEPQSSEVLRKWLPMFFATLLAGGVFLFIVQPAWLQSLMHPSASNPAPTAPSGPVRPLGLYVDSAGPVWRVTWNPNATALHAARNVQLFVREGDDQNRIELSPADLIAGTYAYRPSGNDVTFRLEVTEESGRVSAESFRLNRAAAPGSDSTPTVPRSDNGSASPSGALPPAAGPPATGKHITPPRAIRKVPPSVPSSIRPRITGRIPIEVLVRVDTRGRVISATPIGRPQSGLQTYLAGRAVAAAKQWRFEPAREDGKPVQGTETIHFDFEK